jgi:hypothetical protein
MKQYLNDYKTYSGKLKDPRWQKMRLKIMQRDRFCCKICLYNDKPLNVHHIAYDYSCEPWEVDENLLITLCEECHKNEEKDLKQLHYNLLSLFRKNGFLAHEIHKIVHVMKYLDKELLEMPFTFDIIEYIFKNRDIWNISSRSFFDHKHKED